MVHQPDANQIQYNKDRALLEAHSRLYGLRHFGDASAGDAVDSVLHKEARSYSLRDHEWLPALNLYIQGKSPIQIAEHICERRGFDLHRRAASGGQQS